MADLTRAILYLDLENKTSEIKVHSELAEFVGGLGIGLKLAVDLGASEVEDPLILTVGPLTGLFPGCERAIVLSNFRKSYLDGPFASELRRSNLWGVVITGASDTPCYVAIEDDKIRFGDASFLWEKDREESKTWFAENEGSDFAVLIGTDEIFKTKNLKGLIVRGSQPPEIPDPEAYQRVTDRIKRDFRVEGIKKEEIGNRQVLLDCLVADESVADIYAEIPIAFSCLEVVGYAYTHEELEGLSEKIEQLGS